MSRVGGKETKGRGQQNLLRAGLEGQGDFREAWGLGRETGDGLLGEADMPSLRGEKVEAYILTDNPALGNLCHGEDVFIKQGLLADSLSDGSNSELFQGGKP